MVCRVIDECRCYAYKGETNQFCGTRRDLMLFTVPKTAVLVDALTMVLVNHSGS